MPAFDLEFIKQQVPAPIFQRGKLIHKNNDIKMINMEIKNKDTQNQILKITFKVLSSQSENEYKVSLDFYFKENTTYLQSKDCQCMYFQSYWTKCKHIIAALLYCYYQAKGNLLTWSGLSNLEENLISWFKAKHIKTKIPLAKTVTCQIMLEFENITQAKLTLKVGINQLFDVKDIFEFIKLTTNANPTLLEKQKILGACRRCLLVIISLLKLLLFFNQ